MKLTITERLIVQRLIIKQGGLIEMTLAKSVLNKVSITAEEINHLEMKDTPNGVQWNPHKEAEPKDFNLTHEEIGVLKESVKQADQRKEIYMDMLEFCKLITDM